MKVKGTARILLHEVTREWEFEYDGQEHTFREYEGLNGRQMWLDGEEVDEQEEEILGDMTAEDIYDYCSEYEYEQRIK